MYCFTGAIDSFNLSFKEPGETSELILLAIFDLNDQAQRSKGRALSREN